MSDEPMEPEVVLYHALAPGTACDDGWASFYVALKWASLGVDRNVDGIGVVHSGGEPPWHRIIGKRVLIVDFSYPRSIMENVARRCAQVVVLDHHVSAQRNLKDLPYATFDMNRSGAGLAWDYFFPGKPRPHLIAAVEDNDLWRHKLPFSRELAAWVRSMPKNYGVWEDMVRMLETPEGHEFAVREGQAILREQNRVVQEIANQAWIDRSPLGPIAYVHSPVYQSEIADHLAESRLAEIILIWRFGPEGEVVLSLRTRKEGLDISRLAEKMGGGGHAGSAGATIRPDSAKETVNGQVRAFVWRAAEKLADELAGKKIPTKAKQKPMPRKAKRRK